MYSAFSFSGVKEMVIDFVCREDLNVTTLKEFFEIFIASIKKQQQFHKELLNPIYNHIGIAICFNETSGIGTMRILMAENVGK